MRTAAELNLKGRVRSVETYRAHISTKSYRLLAGGSRELLQDFGDAAQGTEPPSMLFSFERLDEQGRVIEDIDVDRPLIDQEAYRRLYTYDDFGRLAETVDYDENDRIGGTRRYAYSADGTKISEEGWSSTGLLRSRSEFDGQDNRVRVTWFREDGTTEREYISRYQYSLEGNVSEHILLKVEEQPPMSKVGFYAPLQAHSAPAALPFVHRTVFIRGDDGRLREQVQYLPDGSLHKKKVFDESGVLREEQFSFGRGDLTTSEFDSYGRVLKISVVSPAGFLSSRGADNVTTFRYDEQGNELEQTTTASDGTLERKVTNAYRYDDKGNWIECTEVDLDQTWKTEPFPASFETICRFTRKLDYFEL